jgi:anthranilate 1,2-dioxygenase small subunit
VRLGLPVGMMLDDCHERLRDRVKYVNEVWNHAVEHYQPRHMLSRDLCAWNDDGAIAASTNFSVFYTNAEGKSALLATGHYEDLIVEEDGALRFASKRAVMDTAVPPRYIIYPL